MADTSSRKPTSGPGNPGSQSKSTSAMVPVRARRGSALARAGLEVLPAIVTRAGEDTARRFLEFFTANIRNRNTRAAPVRGPKHVVKTGKTPVLDADQARKLLDAIPLTTKDGSPCLVGLRDRALIGVMVFSFARVGAVVAMRSEDYFADGKRWAFRLHEKGGKLHKVPAHHLAEEYVDAYLEASGLRETPKAPLFQSVDRSRQLSGKQLHRVDVFRMIRRRAKQAGLNVAVCCHTFRATGITTYLENGGSIENAQAIANHESPRTTKLYDRTSDELTLDEVERIRI